MPDDQKNAINQLPQIGSLIVSVPVVTPWKILPFKFQRADGSTCKTDDDTSVSASSAHKLDWEYGSAPSAKGRFHLYPEYIDCECFPLALLLPGREIQLIEKCYEVLNILRNKDSNDDLAKESQISDASFFRLLYRKNEKGSKFPLLQSFQNIVQYGPAKTWDSLDKHLHQLARNYEELAKDLAHPPLLNAELTGTLIANQGTPYKADFYHSLSTGSYGSNTPVHICAADGLLSRMLPRNGWTKNPKNPWIRKASQQTL